MSENETGRGLSGECKNRQPYERGLLTCTLPKGHAAHHVDGFYRRSWPQTAPARKESDRG